MNKLRQNGATGKSRMVDLRKLPVVQAKPAGRAKSQNRHEIPQRVLTCEGAIMPWPKLLLAAPQLRIIWHGIIRQRLIAPTGSFASVQKKFNRTDGAQPLLHSWDESRKRRLHFSML